MYLHYQRRHLMAGSELVDSIAWNPHKEKFKDGSISAWCISFENTFANPKQTHFNLLVLWGKLSIKEPHSYGHKKFILTL